MKETSVKWFGLIVGAAAIAAFVLGLIISGALGIFPDKKTELKANAHVKEKVLVSPDIEYVESPFVAVSEEALPAVVNISTSKKVTVQSAPFDDPFFREFFGDVFPNTPREQTRHSLGSGFIFRADGYILTNNHVVADADRITITLHDGRSFEGSKVKIIGRDPKTDLAVLKISTKEDLATLRLGDSDSLRVGDWAIAIGNPFGLEGTVTVGVISAKGRSGLALPSQQSYQNFIQTDAAINPGNSGGPLCNIKGEVIAINTAITSPYGANVGVGFAVPINMAKNIAQQLIENGSVERGYLGVYPQEITHEMRKSLGLKFRGGVLVADVIPDAPAEVAGIKSGDVILNFDGKKIRTLEGFREKVAQIKPGKTVRIKIWRDGETKEFKVKLDKFPEKEPLASKAPELSSNRILGLKFRKLNAAEREATGFTYGLYVEDVAPNSAAARAGLEPADILLKIDGEQLADSAQFNKIITRKKSAGKTVVLVQLFRQGRRFFVTMNID